MMLEILERRCAGLQPDDQLFSRVSATHVSEMARRVGSLRFILHDLCKLVAAVGEKLGLGDAVVRRILSHTAPKTNVLHRLYVGFNEAETAARLIQIQEGLVALLGNTRQVASAVCDSFGFDD